MKRDSDWKCIKCGSWRRIDTVACECGYIPRIRLTRKQRMGLMESRRIDNYLSKYDGLDRYHMKRTPIRTPDDDLIQPFNPLKDIPTDMLVDMIRNWEHEV